MNEMFKLRVYGLVFGWWVGGLMEKLIGDWHRQRVPAGAGNLIERDGLGAGATRNCAGASVGG
jgi:hypothetical protein